MDKIRGKRKEESGGRKEESGERIAPLTTADAALTAGGELLTDADEQLLAQFFMAAQQEAVADDGFSQRVMERIDAQTVAAAKRSNRLSWLWTLFCVLLALGIFSWLGGWSHLATVMVGFLYHVPTLGQLVQLVFVGVLLILLAAGEVIRRERLSLGGLFNTPI